jgi:hypothetical protein
MIGQLVVFVVYKLQVCPLPVDRRWFLFAFMMRFAFFGKDVFAVVVVYL